ncbi:signal peptide peptidase [Tanacetum coccineum]
MDYVASRWYRALELCRSFYSEAGLFLCDIFCVFFTSVMVRIANSIDAPIKIGMDQDNILLRKKEENDEEEERKKRGTWSLSFFPNRWVQKSDFWAKMGTKLLNSYEPVRPADTNAFELARMRMTKTVVTTPVNITSVPVTNTVTPPKYQSIMATEGV